MTVQTRITLKSLDYSVAHSQETSCFEAKLCFDGVVIADASNDGMGGETNFFSTAKTHAQLLEAKQYAASLPPVESGAVTDDGEKMFLDMDLELLVFELVEEMHFEKKVRSKFKRDMKNNVVFLKGGQAFVVTVKGLNSIVDKKNVYENIRKKNGDDIVILAELPEEKAYKMYFDAVRQSA